MQSLNNILESDIEGVYGLLIDHIKIRDFDDLKQQIDE